MPDGLPVKAALSVAVGGALGSLARYFATEAVTAFAGTAFPWGTVLVNISGCALIGALAGGGALLPKSMPPSFIREFFVIGICGGYTTFSSFSLQTFQLLETGHAARALANVALSVVLCLAATWGGYELARAAV